MPSLHLHQALLKNKNIIDNGDEKPFFMTHDQVAGTEIKQTRQYRRQKVVKMHKIPEEELEQIIEYERSKVFLRNHFIDQVCNALRYQTVNEKICNNDVEILKNDPYVVVIHKLQLLQELTLQNKDRIKSSGKIG